MTAPLTNIVTIGAKTYFAGGKNLAPDSDTGRELGDLIYELQVFANALNAIMPTAVLTAQGDILYRNATIATRLPAGAAGKFLQTAGAAANPAWATPPNVVAGVSDGYMTAAMATKLAGIEALADVTDQTNVEAAATITPTASRVPKAKTADGSPSASKLDPTWLPAVVPTGAGETPGVMIAADKTKLDGIEALADVTDATNVDAAGAVMNADYSAQSVLVAVADDTPLPITLAASTILGRLAAGDAKACSVAEIQTLVGIAAIVDDHIEAVCMNVPAQTDEAEVFDALSGLVGKAFDPEFIEITVVSASGVIAQDGTMNVGTSSGGVELASALALTGLTTAGMTKRFPIAAAVWSILGNATLYANVEKNDSTATTLVLNVAVKGRQYTY
jgi:hypothetical protein